MQSVKTAILKPALRAVQQETSMSQADDEDYEDAFNFFVEMYEYWVSEGIVLWATKPSNMNAGVGEEDPTYTLWTNLVMHISSHFAYEPTMRQAGDAERSFRVLRNRSKKRPMMRPPNNMPRGSANTYRRGFPCDTENEVDNCIETEQSQDFIV